MNPKARTWKNSARKYYERARDAVSGLVAYCLPRRVVYFALVRGWAEATTGDYKGTDATTVSADEVIRRWEGRGSPVKFEGQPVGPGEVFNERVEFLLTASDAEIRAELDKPVDERLVGALGRIEKLARKDVAAELTAEREIDANEAMDIAVFQVAREIMGERLGADEGLMIAYQSNIAMLIHDALGARPETSNEVAVKLIELIFCSGSELREGETDAHRVIEKIAGKKIPTGAELARELGGGDNLVTVDGQIGDDVKVSGVIGSPDSGEPKPGEPCTHCPRCGKSLPRGARECTLCGVEFC